MRTFALFVVWALLLYTVVSQIVSSDDPGHMAQFALLAWLGGLVANELVRWLIFQYRRING